MLPMPVGLTPATTYVVYGVPLRTVTFTQLTLTVWPSSSSWISPPMLGSGYSVHWVCQVPRCRLVAAMAARCCSRPPQTSCVCWRSCCWTVCWGWRYPLPLYHSCQRLSMQHSLPPPPPHSSTICVCTHLGECSWVQAYCWLDSVGGTPGGAASWEMCFRSTSAQPTIRSSLKTGKLS